MAAQSPVPFLGGQVERLDRQRAVVALGLHPRVVGVHGVGVEFPESPTRNARNATAGSAQMISLLVHYIVE